MALKTFGTSAATSLLTVQFNPSAGVMTDSDLALFNAQIQPNFGGPNPLSGKMGTYVSRDGQFYLPNIGWVRIRAGDWLVVDATTGYPFILPNNTVVSGPYVHS